MSSSCCSAALAAVSPAAPADWLVAKVNAAVNDARLLRVVVPHLLVPAVQCDAVDRPPADPVQQAAQPLDDRLHGVLVPREHIPLRQDRLECFVESTEHDAVLDARSEEHTSELQSRD